MSNYVKATNFYAKDALLTGDPAKIIKGSEIDAEYNSISTAIATKADLNSPTFTGVPVAPTAEVGTNTNQLATTKFVQDITGTLGTMSQQNTNSATMTGNSTIDGVLLGYRSIPQDVISSGYTLALSDSGKHVYHTGAASTLVVPTNASVPFPIGAAITLFNNGSGNLTISTSGITVYFAGTTATGNRTLYLKGLATLIKVSTDTWVISGVGLG